MPILSINVLYLEPATQWCCSKEHTMLQLLMQMCSEQVLMLMIFYKTITSFYNALKIIEKIKHNPKTHTLYSKTKNFKLTLKN